MMADFRSTSIRTIRPQGGPDNTAFAAFASCAAAALTTVALVTGLGLSASLRYFIGLGLFAMLTAVFLAYRNRHSGLNIFEYPVSLTILAFVQLGLAPVIIFLQPGEMEPFVTEDGLVKALFLCIIGMLALWGGTIMFRGRGLNRTQLPETAGVKHGSPVAVAIAMFVVGCGAKTYMLVAHMYSFVASNEVVAENLASAQVLVFVSQFATFGLIVIAIEKYWARNPGRLTLIFWAMLLIQCGWGLISGMKAALISNFVVVAAVAALSRKKFPTAWILTPAFALVVLYPAYNSYRYVVRGYGTDVSDFSSAAQAGSRALQTSEEMRQGHDAWISSGIQSSVSRMNGLTSVAQILALGPNKAVLQGDERMWMLPIYPFVPRFIWKSKPILDKGARFSVLLGGSEETSVAVTYPGDCYLLGGWLGVLAGMFAWGMLAEGLAQFLYRCFSKRALFIYISLTAAATSSPIENTVFAFWSGILKQSIAVVLIAVVVYGYKARKDKVRPRIANSRVTTGSWITPLVVSFSAQDCK